jgi:hypothetical protein
MIKHVYIPTVRNHVTKLTDIILLAFALDGPLPR